MSWLQKRPQVSNPNLFYTVGLNKTLVICGLGNPGKDYEKNRHNIGFRCLDNFVSKIDEFSSWTNKKDLKCHMADARLGDKRVIVMKPTTFMNASGEAVQAVLNFYKVDPGSLTVIQDELDIEFGQIRTRLGGSSAGHNGIKSVTAAVGEDNYGRVRIGIGPKPARISSENYVLKDFDTDQEPQLANLFQEVNALLTEYIYGSEPLRNETRSFIV